MNAISRVVSDLTQKRNNNNNNSRKLKYEPSTISGWDNEDKNPMAFSSPFHDPVIPSSRLPTIEDLPKNEQKQQQQIPAVLKLEKGKLDLSSGDYDSQFLKRPNPPLKRMSAAIRGKFSTDFLRSKSLQRLNNKDNDQDQDLTFKDSVEYDCKQTSSLSKIKKQARIIDVHVQQLNNSKRDTDNKNLLKHDQMDSD